MKTFREVIELLGERQFVWDFGDGSMLRASCWTDDPAVLDSPAAFDVRASWGRIGRFDNLRGELDRPLMHLAHDIEQAVPGIVLSYDPADCQFVQ